MNEHAIQEIVECLAQLADTEFQERVWVRGEGPEVSSFDEVVCQLLDDSGLGDLLDHERGAAVLGSEAEEELQQLRTLMDGIPEGLNAPLVLSHPDWKEIVGVAQRAGALIAGLT